MTPEGYKLNKLPAHRLLLAGTSLHPGPHRAARAHHRNREAQRAPSPEPGDRAPPGDLRPATADEEPQDRERPRHLLRRARVRGRPDPDGRGAICPVAPTQGTIHIERWQKFLI